MKQIFIVIVLALCGISSVVTAQTKEDYDVVKLDTVNHAYRQGQLLVKFKDNSSVNVRNRAGKIVTNRQRVQSVIDQLGVEGMEQLMPKGGVATRRGASVARTVTGKVVEDRDLTNLYLIKMDEKKSVKEVAQAFKELDEVEFAEPNYIVYALGATPGVNSALPQPLPYQSVSTSRAATYNDPYYSQQWGPGVVKLPEFWAVNDKNVLGRRPVVAILDTGVDLDHPDLKDNIWVNEKEA